MRHEPTSVPRSRLDLRPPRGQADRGRWPALLAHGFRAAGRCGYLRIPLGVALAVLLVGESVPTSLWAGLVLVVAGVAAMTMRPRWKSKDEP